MGLAGERIFLVTPVEKGSYSNALMVQSYLHRLAGIGLNKTLHSPMFYLSVIGAQIGLSMDERRCIGHWGPNSGMPVRYDQARCCTELASKNKIWQHLEAGFTPVADFEIPRAGVSGNAETLRSQMARRETLRKSVLPTIEAEVQETIVVNHRTAMIHRPHATECARTLCPFIKSTAPDHFEIANEDPGNLHLYIRCSVCFQPAKASLDYPKRNAVEGGDEVASGGASGSSCADSSASGDS